MLDLKVQSFLAVCDEMNFTRAAEKLHITQPAVSMHIKSMEEYYGVSLFFFEGKRFSLTPAGNLIYKSLLSLQNNETYLMESIKSLKDKQEIVNMGATITVGEFMLSDSIASYLNRHEHADISVRLSNTRTLLSQLDNGEIDFAVLEGDFSKAEYAYTTLYFTDFIGVCAPEVTFPKKVLTINSLTSYRLLVRESGSGTRHILENALEEQALSITDFQSITTIGSMNAIIDLVKNGCGVTFLYKNAVTPLLEQGLLKEIPLMDFPIRHEISAVWRKDNIQQDILKNLIHELLF